MMVLKTIFVSTFVVGTFAATDEAPDKPGPPPHVDYPVIDLGYAYKLGKVDGKQKCEISGTVGGNHCKEHHFYFYTENNTIQSDLRSNKKSFWKKKSPLEINYKHKEGPVDFLVKANGVQYYGLDIPVLKNGKPAYLSIICTEKKAADKITEVLKKHEPKHEDVQDHDYAWKKNKENTWKFRGKKIPSVIGSPQNLYRNAGGKNIGFSLGHAVKCKIEKIGHVFESDEFESPKVREFFYHPIDHSIGFENRMCKILDSETEALHKMESFSGQYIAAEADLCNKQSKQVEACVWTIVVEKNFDKDNKDKYEPGYLRLAFQDPENMKEFQRRFRERAADMLRMKFNSPESVNVEHEHKTYESVYGKFNKFKAFKVDRRRLMTRRRLALERLYPRAGRN